MVVAMRDSGGVWRKFTWGTGWVVDSAYDTLLSIPKAQEHGKGAEFLPHGGANMTDLSGRRYPMERKYGVGTHRIDMYVLSSLDPREDGCVVDVASLESDRRVTVGAVEEQGFDGLIETAADERAWIGEHEYRQPWKGEHGYRAESKRARKKRLRKEQRLERLRLLGTLSFAQLPFQVCPPPLCLTSLCPTTRGSRW